MAKPMSLETVKVQDFDGNAAAFCALELCRHDINKSTQVTVTAVPITYDVRINGGLVYSCNVLDNASWISRIIAEDMRGCAYGTQGTATH